MNISEVLPNGNVRIIVPIKMRNHGKGRMIDLVENPTQVDNNDPLVGAIADALQWQQYLDDGEFKSMEELAKHVGKQRALVSHILQLALLSPEIIHLAIMGALPPEINLKSLRASIPADWEEQKKLFGLT